MTQHTIDERTFYTYLAQLSAMGAHQEATTLQTFATLFDPPLQVDEARVERMMQDARVNRAAAIAFPQLGPFDPGRLWAICLNASDNDEAIARLVYDRCIRSASEMSRE